uniref:Alpha-1,6-mannosyl-glycoprotein 2-beta-N-acetylglucosaminyltransferase n=1 Tax=Panagrolaimus superbus TaxID=310955 RepID=A0A914YFN5_9BILA
MFLPSTSMAFMRKVNRCLTVILAISFFCLISIFLTTPPSNIDNGRPYDFSTLNGSHNAPVISALPLNSSKFDDPAQWKNIFHVPSEFEDIVESIEYLNYHHEIQNEKRFGSVNQSTFVIAVQVHQRLEYLKNLIATLKNVKGIENVLIIFSHDMNFEPINTAIKNIDFCRVIQIFYPYNIQIFANIFPGQHPDDCDSSVNAKEAESLKCQNWRFPDKYGHYRIASFSQIKHHWWWKTNYVFMLMERYHLDTYTVFLEEDHYVAPDMIHVLKILIEKKDKFCRNCKLLSLGFYLKNFNNYRNDINKLGVHTWFSSKHNMGMALNATVWKEIKECAKLFCTYDDYNWDWSLLAISVKCMKEKMRVITLKSPRVIHVGECGVHVHHQADCNKAVSAASALFQQVSDALFPETFVVSEISKRMLKPSKPNGGWGDPRDQELCLMNTYPIEHGTFLPSVLLNFSSILPPFDRSINRTNVESNEI